MDYSLTGSSVREILQTRTLEWVVVPSSVQDSKCCFKKEFVIRLLLPKSYNRATVFVFLKKKPVSLLSLVSCFLCVQHGRKKIE